MTEVVRRGHKNFAGDARGEGAGGERRGGGRERGGRGVGTAGEEDDRAGFVVMGVRRVVEVFVQRGAGGENGERQHQHGTTDRDEAVEEDGERMAARHGEALEAVRTEAA